VAAQKAKLKDINISLETNELSTAQLQKAKQGIYQKQEEFAEILGTVAKAKQKHSQLEKTVATIEPAIKAVAQNRLMQFSQGQPARGGSTAISPKATTIVLLALLAGIASGIAFVVLAEVFDHVYRSSGQVARSLGLPMLETIDEIVTA
jgi:capsular polysaccharide biosynthesis protein